MSTTTDNMNMLSNTMNTGSSMKRTDGMKNKFTLSRPGRAVTASKNPMARFMSQKPQGSLIDEALGILSSPGSTTSSKVSISGRRGSLMGRRGSMQRRGSVLTERSASELLMDNSDRLSILVQSGIDIDFDDSDDESDLEV